jgi:hypothetical protein
MKRFTALTTALTLTLLFVVSFTASEALACSGSGAKATTAAAKADGCGAKATTAAAKTDGCGAKATTAAAKTADSKAETNETKVAAKKK